MLILDKPWDSQPQEPAPPAIGSGLRILHNPAAGPINLVDSRAITYTVGSTFATPAGVAREAATSSYSTGLSSAHSVPAGSDFTVVMVITSLSTLTQNAGLFRSATGTDTFALIKTGTGGNYPWVRLAGVNILNATSGAAIPTGRPVTVVVSVRSGSRVDVAWDGVLRHSATHSTATPAFTFSVIGAQGGEFIGPFALFAFSHQALDAVDVSSNPWQLFEPQRIYIPVSASSAGSYTLNLESGSYTITGSDATLLHGYLTNLASGTYTLSGADATLLKNSLLNLESGSYTISGSDITFELAKVMNMESGSYSLTGSDITVLRTYQLNATSGSYTLTGQDVTFVYSGASNTVTIKAGSWLRYRTIQ